MEQSFLFENRLIYQHQEQAVPTQVEGEEQQETWKERKAREERGRTERDAERRKDEEERKATQEKLQQLAAMPIKNEIKALMRDAIVSENPEKSHLANRLLRGEIDIDKFVAEYSETQKHEASWRRIGAVQRNIRKKIAELYEKTESYAEIVPSQREVFSKYVDYLHILNAKDLAVDSQLKSLLTTLSGEHDGLISRDEAKGLYELDPTQPNFETEFRRLTQNLRSTAQGEKFRRRLAVLKEQEKYIERQFQYYFAEVEKIIQRIMSNVMWKGERDKMLEHISTACGITLKEGAKITYKDLNEPGVFGRTLDATITKIECEKIPVFDRQGKTAAYAVGMPKITLSNDPNVPFTLARFKKWIDAVDAVEANIETLEDVHRKIGWDILHLEIKPGLQLEYQRFKREKDGKIVRNPQHVHIAKIENGAIHFNQPVLYKSEVFEETEDYRESLTFPEFVKWYFKNEVERDYSLDELRQSLEYLNKDFNKRFNLNEKENPVITVFKGETLYYPDGSGRKFKIAGVDLNEIKLDNDETFTPPQFFNWVKNNFVRKILEKEKTPEEKKTGEEKTKKLQEELKKEEEKKHETEEAEKKGKEHEDKPEAGSALTYLKNLWFTTTFLSVKDIWNMIVSIKEFVVRKHKRRSQGRYGQVGGVLPGVLGTEFDRIRQTAENEEVHLNEQAMEQWGIFQVKDRMYETANKDVAKACIMTLVKKGEMRWDDHHFWETLNRLTARHTLRGAELFIPHYLPPGKSGEDLAGPAIDALWGQGTYTEWFQKNISTYNSNKNNFEYKGKQLEGDPKGTGGLRGECTRLLDLWRKGEYVNPQEYEELIDFAIKYGKMSAEDKMFYLIAGLITKNPKYEETLLHLDRPGQLNGTYLNVFPLLDYFVDKGIYREETGDRGPLRVKDYEYLAKKYFKDDLEAGKPGMQFSKFLWHVMIFNDNFRTRLSKGLRSAENMDHDDAHLFVPPSSISEIDNITGSPGGGEKKFFTPEGYANVYPGFNQYFISIANTEAVGDREERDNFERKRKQALKDVIKSFVRFDSTINNRFKKDEGERKARLLEHHFNRECVIDKGSGIKLALHRDQLQNLIREIGKAYGMDFSYLYKPLTGSLHDPVEKTKQVQIEKDIENFNGVVDKLFETDNGDRIIELIRKIKNRDGKDPTGLRGIRGWPLARDIERVDTPEGLTEAKDIGLL